jgi:hypothetical protein
MTGFKKYPVHQTEKKKEKQENLEEMSVIFFCASFAM